MKTLVYIFLLQVNAFGQLFLSEVLYNEPGSSTGLEWVEIYNRTETAIDLSDYIFIANGDTSYFGSGSIVQSSAYAILARQLVSSTGNSYEGHWGDSSGFWGDSPMENYPAFEADFSLANDHGYVMILIPYGPWDVYEYNQACPDGYSMERDSIDPPASGWHQCADFSGSTPGRQNSTPATPNLGFQFDVTPRLISRGGNFEIDFLLPAASKITIEIFSDDGVRQNKLLSNTISSQGSFLWDGKDDNGRALPPGVYLVLFHAEGAIEKTRTIPVVIAP